MTRIDEKYLASTLINLLLLPSISEKERQVLLKAKTSLEKGDYFVIVAYRLRISLSLLAASNKLSSDVLTFYSELLRQFPGRELGRPIWYRK